MPSNNVRISNLFAKEEIEDAKSTLQLLAAWIIMSALLSVLCYVGTFSLVFIIWLLNKPLIYFYNMTFLTDAVIIQLQIIAYIVGSILALASILFSFFGILEEEAKGISDALIALLMLPVITYSIITVYVEKRKIKVQERKATSGLEHKFTEILEKNKEKYTS